MAGRSNQHHRFMKHDLNVDNACRLAKALIARYGITYEEAMYKLASFRLNLVCDAEIAGSVAMQAALITAVNAGKRAFHGGVHVALPEGVPSRIPWPGQPALADICRTFGARLVPAPAAETTQTIFFGQPRKPEADDLLVSATGWRGGVAPAGAPIKISSPRDFALGGVVAGSLAVAKGFLRIAGIDIRHHANITGVSLWDPAADWRDANSDGPELQFLPQKLWMLGLGHLGQAYLWTLGLLPYREPDQVELILQDFDRAVAANLGSGLLCSADYIGWLKTRICAQWMEDRGLRTKLIERAFGARTVPDDDEPFVALCGFDSAAARSLLGNPGFDLVIEAGIGSDLASFDHVHLHTFPDATKKPEEIWTGEPAVTAAPELIQAFEPDARCGIIAQTLAGKAISTAFVGAIAGAFVVGEVLRGLHGGKRSEFLRFQCRRDQHPTVVHLSEKYQLRFARSGYVPAKEASPAEGQNDFRAEKAKAKSGHEVPVYSARNR